MFFELQKTLGLSTGVIVSPGGYGKDYSMLADVLAKHPDRFRGIALVKDDIEPSELARLTRLGVRGMRMMSNKRGQHVPNFAPGIAAKRPRARLAHPVLSARHRHHRIRRQAARR